LAREGNKTLKAPPTQTPFILLLLTALVSGCTGIPKGVEPVRPFDVQRYKGEWFEIMRLDHSFERGLTNVTATHTLRDDRSVGVLNKGFDRKNCRWKEADGRAVFQGDRDTASLSVTFFWPFAGGYHVFALDQQDYGWALISGPSRSYLWILARRPDLRVIFTSGYADDAVLRHGISKSDVPFLAKPYTPTTLLSKVREVIELPPANPWLPPPA